MSNPIRYIVGIIIGIIIFAMFMFEPSWYMIAVLGLLTLRVTKDLT